MILERIVSRMLAQATPALRYISINMTPTALGKMKCTTVSKDPIDSCGENKSGSA